MLLEISQIGIFFPIFAFFFTIIVIVFVVMYIRHNAKMRQLAEQETASPVMPTANVIDSYKFGELGEADIAAKLLGIRKKFTFSTRLSVENQKKSGMGERVYYLNDPTIDAILERFPESKVEFQADVLVTNAEPAPESKANKIYLSISHEGEKIIMLYTVYKQVLPNDPKKLVNTMSDVIIYHDRKTKFKFDEVIKIVRSHSVTIKTENSSKNPIFYIHKIVKRGAEYITQSVKSFSLINGPEDLRTMYEDITIDFNNEKHRISLSDISEGIIKAVQSKHNIYIMGTVGTGKTVLGGYLCYELSKQNIGKVFYLNASTVEAVITPEFEGFAPMIFNTDSGAKDISESLYISSEGQSLNDVYSAGKESERQLNIMVIDEAQIALDDTKASSQILLAMLDGEHRRQYNTVYILIFNAEQSHVNPAAFRAGRVDVAIHLTPLKKPTADKAVEKIKENIDPIVDVFDQKLYEHTLKTKNTLPGADKPYALENEITLADIHHCVVPVPIADALKEAVQSKGTKLEKTQTPPKLKDNVVPIIANRKK